MKDHSDVINKFIISFVILKVLLSLFFYVTMNLFFERDIFYHFDFDFYVNSPFEIGRNLGYRWLIWLLGIETLNSTTPILLALIINLSVDIAWIYLFSKYLNFRGLLLFVIMLGLQPYSAVYTFKFTTILFAKIGLYFFCRELFNDGFIKIKKRAISISEILLWTLLTLLRNSNLLISAPYLFLKLRKKPIKGIFLCSIFSFAILYASLDIRLIEGMSVSSWPWTLSYVKDLIGIQNDFIGLIATLISKIFLLFGAREKLHNLGIEPFLVWGIPALELCIYFLLASIQLFGFYIGMRFIFKRYGFASLVILIPIAVALMTVSHQRYLIPFIPICLFGLALTFDSKKSNISH